MVKSKYPIKLFENKYIELWEHECGIYGITHKGKHHIKEE